MTSFLIINAIHFLGYDDTFAYLYFIYLPVLLCVAPAYFLYILSITHENHDVNKRQRLVLFSPAIIMLIANIIVLGFMEHSSRLALVNHEVEINGLKSPGMPDILLGFWIIATLFVFGQISFAIMKVLKIIQHETDLMQKQPSHLAYLEWRWILGISLCVLIFLVINVLIEMVLPLKLMGVAVVYNLLMLISGGIIGYLGMKQDDLLNQVEKISHVETIPSVAFEVIINEEKPVESSYNFISSSEAAEIHKRLINYLELEKPYLKHDFSMQDMCSHLGVSRRKISYVLNEVMQKNFYGIVNEYRIREAEVMLTQEEVNLLKIEVLGEMVGFQSKSSFNACFKKMTGMTPSEYRIRKKLD